MSMLRSHQRQTTDNFVLNPKLIAVLHLKPASQHRLLSYLVVQSSYEPSEVLVRKGIKNLPKAKTPAYQQQLETHTHTHPTMCVLVSNATQGAASICAAWSSIGERIALSLFSCSQPTVELRAATWDLLSLFSYFSKRLFKKILKCFNIF